MNQFSLYKIKTCNCVDESWWKTTYIRGQNCQTKEHYEIQILKCSLHNILLAEHEIIFHKGYSEYCDSCNYWAYGFESPLEFAYIYFDEYILPTLQSIGNEDE